MVAEGEEADDCEVRRFELVMRDTVGNFTLKRNHAL